MVYLPQHARRLRLVLFASGHRGAPPGIGPEELPRDNRMRPSSQIDARERRLELTVALGAALVGGGAPSAQEPHDRAGARAEEGRGVLLRDLERRLREGGLHRGVGAAREQEPNGAEPAAHGRVVQRRLADVVLGVPVRLVVEEQPQHLEVSVGCGDVGRRLPHEADEGGTVDGEAGDAAELRNLRHAVGVAFLGCPPQPRARHDARQAGGERGETTALGGDVAVNALANGVVLAQGFRPAGVQDDLRDSPVEVPQDPRVVGEGSGARDDPAAAAEVHVHVVLEADLELLHAVRADDEVFGRS
mmetsp:Transcript_108567/g.312761  ORF Transcript_108567/g.312761 Transcript_108567/m.312761 type:complete len:303 (-) Transcript_108567:1496-2404(-)